MEIYLIKNMKKNILLWTGFIALIIAILSMIVLVTFPKASILMDIRSKQKQIDSLEQVNLKLEGRVIVARIDSLQLQDDLCTLAYQRDSIQEVADSLNAELFVYQYKIGRIRSYLDIVKKNSTQSKFLRSWISRVIDE